MRGPRAFIILTVYLSILVGLVGLVYFGFTASSLGNMSPELRQNMGKIIFGVVVAMELFLVIFVSPGLTSGAVSSEREQQTFDLLRTTLLPELIKTARANLAAFAGTKQRCEHC